VVEVLSESELESDEVLSEAELEPVKESSFLPHEMIVRQTK